MSSASDAQQLTTAAYINASANVLYLFEACITLSEEYNAIWSRKWGMITWLYASTRYTSTLLSVFQILPPWNRTSCVASVVIVTACTQIQFICLALFSALRVYALLEGKRSFVAGVVLLLNVVPFAINLFGQITSVLIYSDEQQFCELIPIGSERFSISLALGARIPVIIADIMVLLVTWLKTGRAYIEARGQKTVAPLATLLLRDGTIYFLILLVFNILLPINDVITSLENFDLATSFMVTLAPIIVCRFILNLRQINEGDISSRIPSGGRSTSLRFASNMGQPLHTGIEEEDELNNHSTAGEDPGDSAITRPQRESDEEGMSRNDVEAELSSASI